MKKIVFNQALEVNIYIEMMVPDDWDDIKIDAYIEEFPLRVQADIADDYFDPDVKVESLVIDNVYIYDSQVLEDI